MGRIPEDGPLDDIYQAVGEWEPEPSLSVMSIQVAEVQQFGATVTGRSAARQVQRAARIMLAVQYRTAAGRLTAS